MNHETKSPDSHDADIEARIVAWVAGEASPFEIAELEKILRTHPELAIFKRRIEAVHGLLGEAARPEQQPLRMSGDRRSKLLAAMGVPADVNTDAHTIPPTVLATKAAQRNRRWIYAAGTAVAACAIFGLTIATLTRRAADEARLEASAASARKVREERIAQENVAKRKNLEGDVTTESRRRMASEAFKKNTAAGDLAVRLDLVPPEERKVVTDAKFDQPGPYAKAANSVLFGAGGAAAGGQAMDPRVAANAPAPEQPTIVKMDPFTVNATSDVGFVAAGSLAGGRIDLKPELPKSLIPSPEFTLGTSVTGARVASPGTKLSSRANADDALRQGGAGGAANAKQLFAGYGSQGSEVYRFTAPVDKPAEGAVKLDAFSVSAPPSRGFGFSGGLVGTQIVSDDQAKQLVLTNESTEKNRGFLSGLFGHNDADDEKKAKAAVVAGALPTAAEPSVHLDAFSVSATNDANGVSSAAAVGGQLAVALKDTPVAYSVVTKEFTDSYTASGTAAGRKAAKTAAAKTPASPAEIARLEQEIARLRDADKAATENRRKEADEARPASPKPTTLDAERAGQQSLEISTAQEAISTFSLHVSDVSFRLAQAAFARGEAPDASRIRPEEFYNAFDYGDPTPAAADKIGCKIEQSAHPVLQQRNLVRIAMKVPSTGRGAGTPLRLTVLLDTSGSMEREDRAASVRRAFEVLVSLLGPNDRITLIGFARQPRLMAEDLPGTEARNLLALLARTPADGGTNLEEALALASQLAQRHKLAGAQNRVVLLTDGAANLGNANPAALGERVTALRQRGIAFDACGVGLSGIDDDVLEALTRQGDGRYYVLNSPEAADSGFARQLAGAFRPAAENVKVQVRFNPARVAHQRLLGFEQHRLATEDFRDDSVDAAELAADEAAVALYQIEVLPQGTGEVGEVFVRFRDPATGQMVERSWTISYEAGAPAFDRATPSLQLAGTAALLAEKLRHSTLGEQLKLGDFARVVDNVRQAYAGQPRVQEFVTMFGQARRMFRE